jgi:hypothetical protein
MQHLWPRIERIKTESPTHARRTTHSLPDVLHNLLATCTLQLCLVRGEQRSEVPSNCSSSTLSRMARVLTINATRLHLANSRRYHAKVYVAPPALVLFNSLERMSQPCGRRAQCLVARATDEDEEYDPEFDAMERMDKSITACEKELQGIRAGASIIKSVSSFLVNLYIRYHKFPFQFNH